MAHLQPALTPDQVLAERVQFMAPAMLVVFLVLWFVWLLPFDDLLDRRGTPFGADYAMFYVAGQIVLDGSADQLYDQAEHQRRLQALFPGIDESFCLPYRYPPVVGLLMAPLATLPYAWSFTLFFAFSCIAWCTAIWLLARQLTILQGPWRKTILWAVAGWPVAWETLIGGQASMFTLLILCASVVLLRARRFVMAGMILGLAAYKPNVLAFVALGLLLRYPQLLKGALPAGLVVSLGSLLPNGWAGLADYITLSSHLAVRTWDVETPYWKVHGLASWFAALPGVNARACSLLLGLLATVLVVWHWRRSTADAATTGCLAMAVLVSINALCNPYTPIYDLSLLLAGGLLTMEGLSRQHGTSLRGGLAGTQVLLAALYFGPHLSQLMAEWTTVQPFALVLLAITVWQIRQFDRLTNAEWCLIP